MNSTIPPAFDGRRLAVVDVEGNGQHPPEIVELGLLPISSPGEARGEDILGWLVRPSEPITTFVTRRVHGITNEDVARVPPWSAVADQVRSLLADRILVAHNASVEYKVLTSHLPAWEPALVLDSLRLAQVADMAALPGIGTQAIEGGLW
ncbi:3'-5' exonuclease [Amycolatopsis suaedae]|uniref:3'-5' exonuclease n=1 Tax=Amycolatopsis suaedae TaxID=2510978 RepID=UPI0013EF058D|nr:3'-5' exonuclease [Amycolatopsis suaedae]